MARWSGEEKILHAKVVYYGPACGGKTTNLDVLHRILDARRGNELLTVKTKKDSTLFFDLLPFELDDVLGHRVEIKLFTVPGLVRYDATRKVVLNDVDAIVFVADSRTSRREQNIWSMQNLQLNMRNKQIDPEQVPVLFQINKRDLPDAAPAAEVAEWLGLADQQVIPAVATQGEGVLETLKAACQAALERAFEQADERTRKTATPDALEQAIERALAPFAERVASGWPGAGTTDAPPQTPIVLTDDDLLEGAIETSVRLGEGRSTEAARARRLAREADGFRRLGESLCAMGAGTDRPRAVAAALEVACEVLDAAAVTLVAESAEGPLTLEGAAGRDEEPLLGFPSGRQLLRRMMSAGGPCVIDDLAEHCTAKETGDLTEQLRSAAGVQVPHEDRRVLVAYRSRSAGTFEQEDVRFLTSVARHVAAGLEKARAHEDRASHRERLEHTVAATADTRRQRHGSRRAVDRIRERFLANLSGEMQAPVAAVQSAATAIRDYRIGKDERKRLADAIVSSAALLQRQLNDLSRLIQVVEPEALHPIEAPATRLIEEALRVAGHADVRSEVVEDPGSGRFDLQGLARVIASMIDNAVRFSPPGSPVRLRLAPGRIRAGDGEVDAVTVSVLDRGPGVPKADRERIFAPFSHGDGAGDRTERGMGLGLYEARCMARRHGGDVKCKSRKGGGSEFRLTVPLQPVTEETPMEVTHA